MIHTPPKQRPHGILITFSTYKPINNPVIQINNLLKNLILLFSNPKQNTKINAIKTPIIPIG